MSRMMMRIMIASLLSVAVLLLSQACTARLETSSTPSPLQLTVDPIPNEIDTNIPKISGKVSDPGATVYVNDSKALVIEDGTFFAYVELPPRLATEIQVRADASGQSTSRSFTTTFFPNPSLWILNSADTRSDPARLEGWVSYPDAQIELTGDLANPIVEIREDGFFSATFSLSGGFQYPGDDRTSYEITVGANTPRGKAIGWTEYTAANSAGGPDFILNDVPVMTRKVYVERGKTVLLERAYYFSVPSPVAQDLELVPDPEGGSTSEELSVNIEPRSFLLYPDSWLAPRSSTVIIRVGDEVPAGSYFFRANRGDHIEVIVE